MKSGIILSAVGIVLLLATLILSEGYDVKRPFLGNIQNMQIVIKEGVATYYPEVKTGFVDRSNPFADHDAYTSYEGRVEVGTRYPFLLSLVVTIAGIVVVLISITSRPRKM